MRTFLVAVSVLGALSCAALLMSSRSGSHDAHHSNRSIIADAEAAEPPAPKLACGKGTTGVFYGIAGHLEHRGAYRMSDYDLQISQLRDLGITMYAQDVSSEGSANMVADFARAAAKQCIGVLALVTPFEQEKRANEQETYERAYALGKTAGRVLKGVVTYYQVGNEYDNWTIRGADRSGEHPSDYDNAMFMKARGSILGLIKGIRESNPDAKILLTSFSWLHYGFTDMLFAGTQPDGSSGHPIPQWDITAWHWYSNMGSITAAGQNKVNVLERLRDSYGKPIWITEYGVRPNHQDPGGYLVGKDALKGFVSLAKTYNVQNVTLYELYDDQRYGGDGNYGVIADDGKTRKPRFNTVRDFIKSNPMP
ncbi:glycosyl hydrolase [Caballeronia sp. LZ035]|uniref:glycosyl hydrolase n=1 Tax=Caballeronia sp. LZ035 TaxID=3038568 RepID=UPI0028565421|nr:glycosyl hydrolase [Caballeronia sp. LZ035]MDR5761854.1 glycosyl hydrolase [Caballeronia sp. LZ035]